MGVLAVDFGGTRIKAGIVEEGEILVSRLLDTPQGVSLEDQLPKLKDHFLSMIVESNCKMESMVWALPCIVSADQQGVTRTFGKYDDSATYPLVQWARDEFQLPMLLENDARAAAVGEWGYGAGQGVNNMVMVTLGTGIGTAAIVDGRVLRGAHGVAGNLGGHSVVNVNGRSCECGLTGCLEAHVATWALPSIAAESPLFSNSSLSQAPIIDYLAVFQHAKAGDCLAAELRDRALHYWMVMLVNLHHQYDPERIVLGGGIMAGEDDILPPLKAALAETLDPLHRSVQLRSAALADSAALVGCEQIWRTHTAHST